MRASVGNLEAREQAEAQLQAAKEQEKTANRAERDKAQIKGAGRAVGLRVEYTAQLVDRRAFLNFYAVNYPEHLETWLAEQAQRLVRSGNRALPGVTIIEGSKV